ncbi:MAG: class I SAM-dependent methyltransferase [Planctomycetota bacterium]|jgi:SAM-dependent methyltransferase
MSERWAQEFELRARAVWTDDAVHRVTEGKDLPILPSNAPPLLRALGLLHRDASMPPPQVRKFLQLNHMIRMLRPPLLELIERGEPLHFVDAGCGLSYLTLSLAWCFRHVFRHPATLVGIDRDERRVAAGRASAAQLGLDDVLTFQAGAIGAFEPEGKVHVILALHACDTATDDAIALGLRHGAELIAVAPCCQAELARAWAELATSAAGPLQPLWSTPHLRREAAATVTDTMRALLLRAAGYETRVVEFVPSQHTPKNTLIRAMRRGGPDEDAARQYTALRDATGGAGISLARSVGS